jgi:hypothetical protein
MILTASKPNIARKYPNHENVKSTNVSSYCQQEPSAISVVQQTPDRMPPIHTAWLVAGVEHLTVFLPQFI